MSGKGLLNYRTSVPAHRTIGEIQSVLVKAGAKAIASQYDGGEVTSLRFVMATAHGDRQFELPVNVEPVAEVLRSQRRAGQVSKTSKPIDVAWRILKDWVEAQVAILETEMVTIDQVLLPFMLTPSGETVYSALISGQLALEAGE